MNIGSFLGHYIPSIFHEKGCSVAATLCLSMCVKVLCQHISPLTILALYKSKLFWQMVPNHLSLSCGTWSFFSPLFKKIIILWILCCYCMNLWTCFFHGMAWVLFLLNDGVSFVCLCVLFFLFGDIVLCLFIIQRHV